MDVSGASWLVIIAALMGANLPFLNESLFGVVPLGAAAGRAARRKPFVLRLLELIVLYFLVGAFALVLETRLGDAYAQGWEFYAITFCLFIVLSFPGFVVRYLRKRKN